MNNVSFINCVVSNMYKSPYCCTRSACRGKTKPVLGNLGSPGGDLSSLNKFFKAEKFKMETPETIGTSLQTGEWVTSINFKDAYFHIPTQPVTEMPEISRPGQNILVQSTTIWPLRSTNGVHYSGQRGQTDDLAERYKDPPVPRRLL